jgi:pimeloyl-ACP methyl ester carboxylesterase
MRSIDREETIMIALAQVQPAAKGEMLMINTPHGVNVHYDRYGQGPPLVLVHGSFSDHVTNWSFVADALAEHFTVHAVARRGRGATDATDDHDILDEGRDVAAVIREIGKPVFLLGHSYGALVALAAAAEMADRIRRLVLYEPPVPGTGVDMLSRMEEHRRKGDWDGIATTFFGDVLLVPPKELKALRESEAWSSIIADARPSLEDVRAMKRSDIDAERFRGLSVPVVLQIGSESPRDFFFTDTLAAVLPDVRIEVLEGQAHEGMTAGPEQYAKAVQGILSQ